MKMFLTAVGFTIGLFSAIALRAVAIMFTFGFLSNQLDIGATLSFVDSLIGVLLFVFVYTALFKARFKFGGKR